MARPEPLPSVPSDGALEAPPGVVDPYTAMTGRFGWVARLFGHRFFAGFSFEEGDAERLKALEQKGAVIYVMRYSSRLDYFLFNWLFLKAGVRLSSFANGIRFYYYRPIGDALRFITAGTVTRVRHGFQGMRERGFVHTRKIVREGESAFLFLRTDKIRTRITTRPRAVKTAMRDIDYLREVVDTAFAHDTPVALVPLALFWRKGSRPQSRFLNVFYGAPQRPSDTGKVLSFLWNYKNLAVRVGEPIDLSAFVEERRAQGSEAVTRQVRRSLLIFLRREEKPVLGAALRPLERTTQQVLADPEVREAMADIDASRGRFATPADTRARRYLREIAAHPSPSMLAVLDVLVTWMFNRLFARVEVYGLDRIVEAAKRYPLVLVPSHRSHFDYLILSWLFYERHLVPPLVAAGINLSFWPLGPIFRRGGGFFLRRTFEGNRLYATVFRAYVQGLIKDGVTQEFFIEGTRSRTGKTLQPRMGMLGMVCDAFARGVRQDVRIVPIGFTYERLVEEGSMTDERKGATKTAENLVNLLRAGRVLQNRFGAVTVRFGEPISLAEHIDVERYGEEAARREMNDELAWEISRRINGLITAGRSSVSAAALLGSPNRALRLPEFRTRVEEVAALLERVGLARSENLQRNLAQDVPEAAAELLLQSGAVERVAGSEGEIVRFTESARDRLAYYRATIAPALASPAALALALRADSRGEAVLAGASSWLDVLALEFFPQDLEQRRAEFDRLLEHFSAQGWIRASEGGFEILSEGEDRLVFLARQLRPVLETYRALLVAAAESSYPTKRGDLVDRAQKVLEEQLLLGEALYPEALCPTTLGNAVLLLVREGILQADGNPRSSDVQMLQGLHWGDLGPLRERVATTLRNL